MESQQNPTAPPAPDEKEEKPVSVRVDHKKHNKSLIEENVGLKAKIKELEQQSLPLQSVPLQSLTTAL